MIDYANTQILRLFVTAQALVANRKGADSLEWIAIAVVIVVAIVAVMATIGAEITTKGQTIIEKF